MSAPPQRRVSVWIKSKTKFAAFAPLFQFTEWEQLVEYEANDLLTLGLPPPAAVPLSKIINKLKLEDGTSAEDAATDGKSEATTETKKVVEELKATKDFQNMGWEDPSSLPFELPATLKAVDCTFMTTLLRFRNLIGKNDEVVSMEECGVGVTAGFFSTIKKVTCKLSPNAPTTCPTQFVVKAWPEFELLPAMAIASLFKADIMGYTHFPSSEFYPRPDVYLATFDEAKARYVLIMADCDSVATQAIHEKPLNLEQVRAMIPILAHVAAKYEGSHEPSHPDYEQTKHMRHWSEIVAGLRPLMAKGAPLFDETVTGVGHPSGVAIHPFEEEPDDFLGKYSTWQEQGLGLDFAQQFTRCEKELSAQITPEFATCSISHGDLRGDNLFFNEKLPHGWMAIDYQMNFKGPVVSDLAYILMTGTVQPEVYQNHTDELIEFFYTEFMKKTSKYKEYTLKQCRFEFSRMMLVPFIYFYAMGASGLIHASTGPGNLGTRTMTYDQIPLAQKRRRFYYKTNFMNWSFLLNKFEARKDLEKCVPQEIDFRAAFDFTKPRGAPLQVPT